ncbi:glycosyl transferase [Patescibacteria group bacterium]
MDYNFCTPLDKNYLYRGIALHTSLINHCPNFKLWILCMDDVAYNTLNKMQLDKVEIISLKEVENEDLLSIKSKRRGEEYCWTCKPALLLYILKNNKDLDIITYLDSDTFFFSSPEKIFNNFLNKSIILTPHRFPPENKNQKHTKGIYNAGMLSFKNNIEALKCLQWWNKKCIEWCYHYYEAGKMSDQLYLNDWTERFRNVYILEHKGINLAPWNVSQYTIIQKDNKILIDGMNLIFYHFQSLKIYSKQNFKLSYDAYELSPICKKLIYKPYLSALVNAIEQIETIDKSFNYGFTEKPGIFKKFKKTIKNILKKLWSKR